MRHLHPRFLRHIPLLIHLHRPSGTLSIADLLLHLHERAARTARTQEAVFDLVAFEREAVTHVAALEHLEYPAEAAD